MDYIIMPKIVDIRKRYEQLFPMTTWSDEEIKSKMHDVEKKTIVQFDSDISVNMHIETTLEEYMKTNNCSYLEDFIVTLRNGIK